MTPSRVRMFFTRLGAFVFTLLAFSAGAATLPAGFIDLVVAAGFTNVSSMAIAPDGRIFVAQQSGQVRVVKNGAVLPSSFVTVGASMSNWRGLIGIALDPHFATNNFIYLHYATNASVAGNVVQRVSRFVANGDVALSGSETVLVETDPTASNAELGGGLAFGLDEMLYIGVGQGGPSSNSQITNSLFGKVLRIQRDGTIPSDNPFFNLNTGKNRAVWALGFRNPFVLSFQPGTDRLFINDVGSTNPVAREEINEGVAGGNYGWPTCEGNCASPNPALRNPLYFYPHTNNLNAITGGAFYNPAASLYPTQYLGKYFFGDLNTATIQLFDPATTNASPFAARLVGRLVSLQVGPDGALYYLVQSVTAAGGGMVGKIIPGAQTLFSLGTSWKYLDAGTTNLPASWTQLAFDDSAWSNGIAQFGYGDGGERTLIRSTGTNGARVITTYFRKTFVVTNAPYSSFVVSVIRDDGAVVYLNGTEVFRSNIPQGPVTSGTLAPVAIATSGVVDDESATHGAIVDRSLVLAGTNLLAVELHQQSATSSDTSFDLAFYGLTSAPSLSAIISATNIVLRYPSWAAGFTLESTLSLPAASWNVVTNLPTDVSGIREVVVPANKEQEFFRLRSP